MSLEKIDPALGLLKEFSKATKGTVQHIDGMRSKAIFTDGEVSSKYKILSAMLWSISARCEPCIKFYVSKAIESGVSENEFGEFLAIANTMGGCVGEMWALKAYQAFRKMRDGDEVIEPTSCCQ